MINPHTMLEMYAEAQQQDGLRYMRQAALEKEARNLEHPRRRWLPTLPSLRGIRVHRPHLGAPRKAAPMM